MTRRAPTILIVDDDPDILDMLVLFLEECGYQVQTMANATDLYAFPHGVPDLLLLDIWLSGLHGGDLCRQLKSQPETQTLPVLLISANREIETIANSSQADGFVPKPFDLDELLSTIEKHLGSKLS